MQRGQDSVAPCVGLGLRHTVALGDNARVVAYVSSLVGGWMGGRCFNFPFFFFRFGSVFSNYRSSTDDDRGDDGHIKPALDPTSLVKSVGLKLSRLALRPS